MIKAIIIDDELHCINALQNDLSMFCPQVAVLECCQTPKEAMLAIRRANPDLVFLDIEMPWMNGFEMLEALGDFSFQIIFTTAYNQFAAKAFRVSAVDYLLKPVDGTELMAAVAKVEKRMPIKGSDDNSNVKNLIHNSRSPVYDQKIAVPNRDGFDFLHVSDILYLKANGSYTDILLTDGKKIVLSKSLGETELLLPQELFERIHHSSIVNVNHIKQFIRSNGTFVVMKNGEELNVSKSKKEHLLRRLGIK